MNEITTANRMLPETLPELSKFVLIGREKLNAVRAEIRAIEKVGLAKEVHEQKLSEAQEIAEAVLDAEVKIGELTAKLPKASADRGNQYTSGKSTTVSVSQSKEKQLSDIGIPQRTAERFESLARHPEEVQKAKETAQQENRIVTRQDVLNAIEEKKKPHVVNNSGDNEWYTPPEFIEAARTVMGSIDLDPASNELANKTVRAHTFYTAETNGLDKEWNGNVWLNPPYSTALVQAFTEKVVSSNFQQAVILVNNATDTAWFRKLIDKADAILFTTGRIRFYKTGGEKGTPLQGQAFIYYGNNAKKFLEVFSQYGWGCEL